MSKRVYISADYSENSGDRNVVETLNSWGNDNWHIVDFVDMSQVVSGSVSNNSDCRPCDLKKEFNKQINASSATIFVIGDKTSSRTAGSECSKVNRAQILHPCTPYKQNTKGYKYCKFDIVFYSQSTSDVCEINTYSYLRHEFEQSKEKNKTIIIVYNSTRYEQDWLPTYMNDYKDKAFPFWTYDFYGRKVGDYSRIKEALGYE